MKLKSASAAHGISIGDTIRRALAAAGLGTVVTPPLDDTDRRPRAGTRSVPGKFVERSYSNAAGARRYKLYVPENCPEGRRPLLVMLHGCTQNPDDFAAGTRMNEIAEQHGFLVAYPAQAANANVSQCWNWFNVGDQVRDLGEPSLIAGITREIAANYCIDTQRIFVAGLSAGAAMAVILGATYPDLFAAVGAHSGLPYRAAADMPSAFAAMRGGSAGGLRGAGFKSPRSSTRDVSTRGPSTIVFHGDQDTTVHADNGDRIVAEALTRIGMQTAGLKRSVQRQSSAGGRQSTIATYRDAALRPLVEYWVVHGAGHAWAGGSPEGSFIDANGPDASAEMARFFLAQT